MAADKRTAIWLSHSSTSDFLKCPRCYYLKNVYKDPKTGKKIKLVAPSLSLGQAVHEVLEGLSTLRAEDRFKEPVFDRYDLAWKKISGKMGGFFDEDNEQFYKLRGREMLTRVVKNPGPLKNLAIKVKTDSSFGLLYYFLSEEDNVILCGKVDWLEYLPETDSVCILDFKTGKHFEDPDSLQLPIYHLLVKNTQQRVVSKACYWYLESSDTQEEKVLPNIDESKTLVLKLAKDIKLARTLEKFHCDGCEYCQPYEDILSGKAEKVEADGRYDYYAEAASNLPDAFESEIL